MYSTYSAGAAHAEQSLKIRLYSACSIKPPEAACEQGRPVSEAEVRRFIAQHDGNGNGKISLVRARQDVTGRDVTG